MQTSRILSSVCVLQSLILHYRAVFSPDSLAPVTEVSIDQAIARVARTSPSLEPETARGWTEAAPR